MKKCPFCDHCFPEDKKICPKCSSPYWEPEEDRTFNESHGNSEDEERGCLSLFFMPVTVSLFITVFLVLTGFIINLFIHFESSQMKLIWIALSIIAGMLTYRFIIKKQKNIH